MSSMHEHIWNRSHQGEPAPAGGEIEHLEKRIDMLTLVSRALWELLEKKTGLEERDLVAKVAEIDLRDGHLDQTLRNPSISCPDCGREVNARTHVCIHCGFRDFSNDIFDKV